MYIYIYYDLAIEFSWLPSHTAWVEFEASPGGFVPEAEQSASWPSRESGFILSYPFSSRFLVRNHLLKSMEPNLRLKKGWLKHPKWVDSVGGKMFLFTEEKHIQLAVGESSPDTGIYSRNCGDKWDWTKLLNVFMRVVTCNTGCSNPQKCRTCKGQYHCSISWYMFLFVIFRVITNQDPYHPRVTQVLTKQLGIFGCLPKGRQMNDKCRNEGFLKWWYPQIIHFHRIFQQINHPAIGVCPFMENSRWM